MRRIVPIRSLFIHTLPGGTDGCIAVSGGLSLGRCGTSGVGGRCSGRGFGFFGFSRN